MMLRPMRKEFESDLYYHEDGDRGFICPFCYNVT